MKTLDEEEKNLIESLEHGQWVPIKDQEHEAEKLKSAARATFKLVDREGVTNARGER